MAQEQIEVDPAVYNDDSDYASSGYDTSTQSLTSTVNGYIFENGRRYHAYFGTEKNMMPTDEAEQDRLDLHHEVLLNMLEGELHLAPVKNPQAVLDVGTGTGIWAIDVADKFPSAQVIGTDISPIQPGWVPPNCSFELDDAEKSWTYKQDRFDLIHLRNLAQSISDWPHIMTEAYRCTKPGGWVEHAEFSMECFSDDNTHGPNYIRLITLFNEALNKIGRPSPAPQSMKAALEKAGFVDATFVTRKYPQGIWPRDRRLKHIGAMALLAAETGLEAYTLALLTRILGIDGEEAKKINRDALKDIKDRRHHSYHEFYVVYARKPEE